jgi:hypothetical protein
MCGSENCALNRTERKKIGTAETRFLRRVLGYTLTDHARNTTIRRTLQIRVSEERTQNRNKNFWEELIAYFFDTSRTALITEFGGIHRHTDWKVIS